MNNSAAASAADVKMPLSALYLPRPGAYDEMLEASGALRSHWQYLAETLNTLGVAELDKRRQEIRQLLRDNGVTYSQPGEPLGGDLRAWELDPIPLTISSQEWIDIERGLTQRAVLLNLLLQDIYGDGAVFRKKLLPPELVFSHPGFLRDCKDVPPPGERSLHFHAADLVRDPNGQMRVVGDRTQALAGAGYALENRIVLSRVFPSLYRDAHVHRLAQFFLSLRQSLQALSWRSQEDSRIVILSPGAYSETYFEQAYLAKYLGYTLVQGDDLTVREARTWLKTLDGLQPVDVILRWLEGRFCDPLELDADSVLGIAGLVQSARLRNVAVLNPLGTEVIENRALMQFLPALARHFLNEDLLLPSPPTYWCGQAKERAHVLAHLDKLVLRRTYTTAGSVSLRPARMSAAEKAKLCEQIQAEPLHWLAQEEIRGSTVPVLADGELEARQMVLRTFAVAEGADYHLMPGGLARTAQAPDSAVVTSSSGGVSKDVWVLASEPVRYLSLTTGNINPFHLPGGRGELPSRVAENLFWLGRYVERSEGLVRLLRTVFLYLLDPHGDSDDEPPCLHSLLHGVTELSKAYPGFVGEGAAERLAAPHQELLSLLLDRQRSGSLAYNINALLFATRAVRDRLSADIWRVFNDVDETLQRLERRLGSAKKRAYHADSFAHIFEELNKLLLAFAAFNGLALENMTHGQGWRFLVIGRRLERACMLTDLLQAMLGEPVGEQAQPQLLEALLHVCDSQMTYRNRYRTSVQLEAVLDLLIQDETNPRALSHQLERLQHFISLLPRDNVFAYKSAEERLVLQTLTSVRLADPQSLAEVDADGHRQNLTRLLEDLMTLLPQLSDALTNSYFSHAEQPRQLLDLDNEAVS